MMATDWTALLHEPRAILGPYLGKPPPLSAFAPYAWRAQFDHLAIAGQFLLLPEPVPPSWGTPEEARADVVIEFEELRLLRVDGILARADEDDSLHALPHGMPGQCSLTGEVHSWKRFEFAQPGFWISLEAAVATVHIGRRVSGQFGHRPPYLRVSR